MIDWLIDFYLVIFVHDQMWIVYRVITPWDGESGGGGRRGVGCSLWKTKDFVSFTWQIVTRYVSLSLQLVLSVATADMAAQNSNSTLLLPSPTLVINIADSHDRAAFSAATQMKEEPMDVDGYDIASPDVSSPP